MYQTNKKQKGEYYVIHNRCNIDNPLGVRISNFLYHGWCYPYSFSYRSNNVPCKVNQRTQSIIDRLIPESKKILAGRNMLCILGSFITNLKEILHAL